MIVTTGEEVAAYRRGTVMDGLALLPSGDFLLAEHIDYNELNGRFVWWRMDDGSEQQVVERAYEGGINSLQVSPDGKTAVATGWGRLFFWDVVDGSKQRTVSFGVGDIVYATWGPTATQIANAQREATGRVHLWDAITYTETRDTTHMLSAMLVWRE